jgi:hypothetical protein
LNEPARIRHTHRRGGRVAARGARAAAGNAGDRVPREGLKDTGYVEGENAAIVYRLAENQDDRLPELVADLVRRRVAVIATAGTPATFAAQAATKTVPIVFLVGDDPVRLGAQRAEKRNGPRSCSLDLLQSTRRSIVLFLG